VNTGLGLDVEEGDGGINTEVFVGLGKTLAVLVTDARVVSVAV